MKMHVLDDSSGQILAAVELSEGASKNTLQVRPVVKPNQYSADLDVPSSLADMGFKDACERLVVDVTQTVPRLKART
jgi:hypothetical protein